MIRQGERYTHGVNSVLAMETGTEEVKVRRIHPEDPWTLGRPYIAHARELHPEPMRYHGGKVPGSAE